MTNPIFDRLEAHTPPPTPPLPAHLNFTAGQLRAELAATPADELRQLIEQAEDAHHAYLLERWTEESREEESRNAWERTWERALNNLRKGLPLDLDEEALAEEEEAARERARNRGTLGGGGPIATLSGDDERPERPEADGLPPQQTAARCIEIGSHNFTAVTCYSSVHAEMSVHDHEDRSVRYALRMSMRVATIAMVVQIIAVIVVIGLHGGTAALGALPLAACWALHAFVNRPLRRRAVPVKNRVTMRGLFRLINR